MKIFLVIPLFNEEKHIVKVLSDLAEYKLPIVVINDGSTDQSRFKIEDLRIKNLTLLEHEVNLGKGAAMKTGADYAFEHKADAVIFVDADGQHDARDLTKIIDALKTGKYDVVFGSRNFGYGVPLVRYLGNKFASIVISSLFRIYISDVICGFRAITNSAYVKIRWESEGYGVETEMVIKAGKTKLKFCEVPVETIYHDRTKGVTILDAFGIFGNVVKWKLTK